MWVNKNEYERLILENEDLRTEIEQLKDDSGEATIEKITNLAKKAKLDVYSKEYQDIMHRLFMDIAGRHSNVIKGYSQSSFMKDNPQEILERLQKFQKEASIITKGIEDKTKK